MKAPGTKEARRAVVILNGHASPWGIGVNAPAIRDGVSRVRRSCGRGVGHGMRSVRVCVTLRITRPPKRSGTDCVLWPARSPRSRRIFGLAAKSTKIKTNGVSLTPRVTGSKDLKAHRPNKPQGRCPRERQQLQCSSVLTSAALVGTGLVVVWRCSCGAIESRFRANIKNFGGRLGEETPLDGFASDQAPLNNIGSSERCNSSDSSCAAAPHKSAHLRKAACATLGGILFRA
jgi:hypothetical protein